VKPLVPPPLLALGLAAGMWAVTWVWPVAQYVLHPVVVGSGLAVAGLLFAISAFLAFQKARTTVSPIAIDQASSLVTSGPFAISRNPMYLGLALVLLGWAIGLGAATALAGPVIFVILVTIFQIRPEERVLREKFGDAYADYCKRVRRWI
jgi:protein-S-isoprenylcysteine O-methyltransferase Ste14